MHSALLPVHDQFLPRERGRQQSLLRRWRASAKRQTLRGVLKRVLVVLAVVFLLVRLAYLPIRTHYAIARREKLYEVSREADVNAALTSTSIRQDWGPGVEIYDFSKQTASPSGGAARGERVLLCLPVRNAAAEIELLFFHLHRLTYDHALIDVAFLVSDSEDQTYDLVVEQVSAVQNGAWEESKRFNRVDIYRHDFGAVVGQGFDTRHDVAVQAERRKLMGRARNWLLGTALRPEHSWVYWRDADIERSPATLLEDLMKFDKDVIVPNVWRPLPKWLGGQQPYDLNSWQESDSALELARQLNEDDVIVEGYAEYTTWRVHLAYLRADDGNGNPDEIIDLDGVGGVSILAKARVFRAGANFPGFSFENHVETEGFGKMCRKLGFSVAGLPQYTVWHKYEPSDDDLEKMAEMERAGLSID